MNPQILEGVAAIAFLFVQAFAVAMFFIVRFHFRNFAAPGDRRAVSIVRSFGFGIVISIGVAGFILLKIVLAP